MSYSICIFSAFFPPHVGGIENYSNSLAKELCFQGNDVTVVTSQNNTTFFKKHLPFKIIQIPSVSLFHDRFPVIKLTAKTLSALKTLKSFNFDLVLINARYYPLTLLALHFAKSSNTEAILIDHSSDYLSFSNNTLDSLFRLYEQFMNHTIRKYQPTCYGVSQKSKTWLKSLNLPTGGVLPNSINTEEFLSMKSNRSFKNQFNITTNSTVITFAGRLIKEKGAEKLIKAFQILNLKYQNLTLFIAGDGDQLHDLQKYSSNSIHLLGSIDRADLSSLFYETDIFCLPSDYPEGLPSVLLEAGSNQCALVISDTGGSRDLVASRQYGWILTDTHIETIAEALEYYILRPSVRKKVGKNLQEHIKLHFSWETTARKVINICKASKAKSIIKAEKTL